jgi:hypothetical protein
MIASHASEHSNNSYVITLQRLTAQQVRQPTYKRPDWLKTNTRIQMHQNLFTLTKNNSVPQQLSWEQTSKPLRCLTFAGTNKPEDSKLEFPCNKIK